MKLTEGLKLKPTKDPSKIDFLTKAHRDGNKYTHTKLSSQTWEQYFVDMNSDKRDKFMYVDCRIAIELVRLFNDVELNNEFTIEFPFLNRNKPLEEYIFVGDTFDYAFAPYINAWRGVWVIKSLDNNSDIGDNDCDMYIGLSNEGLVEKTKKQWKLFLMKIYKENFSNIISKEEFLNRKIGMYKLISTDCDYYITNPNVEKLKAMVHKNKIVVCSDETRITVSIVFNKSASVINIGVRNGMTLSLYSLDTKDFEIGTVKYIVLIISVPKKYQIDDRNIRTLISGL